MSDLRAAALQALEALEQDNPAGRSATIIALRAALEQPEQQEQIGSNAERLLRDALVDAQWCDKWIYPVYGKNYQNWKIQIYLPVPESATDKSPEAALNRVLKRRNT